METLTAPPIQGKDTGGETTGWIVTYTGGWIEPLDPNPEHINVYDLAHALGMCVRFTGHVREFYSVGQHSVLASYGCDEADALWGLLHDASEAYLSDIASPIKKQGDFEFYKVVEARLMEAICTRFDLPPEMPESVHRIDKMLLRAEQRDLMPNDPSPGEIYEEEIRGWHPGMAEAMFLARYNGLTGEQLEVPLDYVGR